jgi:division protein CdvB (Snf7/Vps24/ESCRT-III family)
MPSTELKLEIEQALNNVTEKTLQPQSLADVVRKILEEDSRLLERLAK